MIKMLKMIKKMWTPSKIGKETPKAFRSRELVWWSRDTNEGWPRQHEHDKPSVGKGWCGENVGPPRGLLWCHRV